MGKILVIEDSAYQRAKLSRLLKAAGHDLVEVGLPAGWRCHVRAR